MKFEFASRKLKYVEYENCLSNVKYANDECYCKWIEYNFLSFQ